MNIFDLFETDADKIKNGVEIKVADAVFICRPNDMTNQFYAAELSKLHTEYAVQLKVGALSEKESSDLMLKVFCKTVLIGWKNLKDKSGKEIEYSETAAFELLSKMPKLLNFLKEQLAETKAFNAHNEKEELKN